MTTGLDGRAAMPEQPYRSRGATLTRNVGASVESVQVGAASAEQHWTFAARPSAGAAIGVRVSVEGARFASAESDGLHFTRTDGRGFLYGHGTWVDARGTSTRVPSRWMDGMISLDVPADVVARSEFPAVLDPFISPEINLDPGADGATRQRQMAAASDGTNWLVVWNDDRNLTANGWDVYGSIVNSSGMVIGTAGFPICTTHGDDTNPAIAWNGREYYVLWNSAAAGPTQDIHAARVPPSGIGITTDFPIFVTSGEQLSPAIACNLSVCLAVWRDTRTELGGDIYAARMTASAVMDAPGALLSSTPGPQARPNVGWDGTNFLVTWVELRAGATTTVATRVTVGTTTSPPMAMDTPAVVLGPAVSLEVRPSLAFGFGMSNVVWSNDNGTGGPILMRGFAPTASLLPAMPAAIVSRGRTVANAAVSFDGLDFWVAWDEAPLATMAFDIGAARANGVPMAIDMPTLRVSATPAIERLPSLATGRPSAGGPQTLVAYSSNEHARARILLDAPTRGCGTDSECDDGNPCTADACTAATCVNTPIPACGLLDAGTPDIAVIRDTGIGLDSNADAGNADGTAGDTSAAGDSTGGDASGTADGTPPGDVAVAGVRGGACRCRAAIGRDGNARAVAWLGVFALALAARRGRRRAR